MKNKMPNLEELKYTQTPASLITKPTNESSEMSKIPSRIDCFNMDIEQNEKWGQATHSMMHSKNNAHKVIKPYIIKKSRFNKRRLKISLIKNTERLPPPPIGSIIGHGNEVY